MTEEKRELHFAHIGIHIDLSKFKPTEMALEIKFPDGVTLGCTVESLESIFSDILHYLSKKWEEEQGKQRKKHWWTRSK